MRDDLLRSAEGPQVDIGPTEGHLRLAEGRLGSTEDCFRTIEVLIRLKEDHFRPIEDHLGRQMVF